MSVPFLTSLDLNKNEILNVVIQKLATAPASPVEGQIYHNTTTHKTEVWNGTAWISALEILQLTSNTPTAEAVGSTGSVGSGTAAAKDDHRHAMPGLATSGADGFMPATDKAKLDNAVSTATASRLIIRDASGRAQVVDPSAAADIATKNYVDSVAQGLDVKLSVRAVGTTNQASLSGPLTIDGVSLIAGDRVLLTGQTTVTQNGIWLVAAGAWTRPTDYDEAGNITEGAFTFVEEGTSNEGSGWVLSELAGSYGSYTTQTFTQFSGAGQVTAGLGLTKSGNDLSVNVDASTIEINVDTLRVKALGITDSHVAAANKDGAAGTPSMRTLGAGASQAAAGNHTHAAYLQRYAANLTGGAATETVTHNLNTRDVQVQFYLVAAPYTEVIFEVERTSTTAILVKSSAAIAAGTYRVVVMG